MRAHVRITGKVQGVWYRESTRKEAERHGLDGWVRNLADGSVEALFEGPDEAVDRMLDWCHEGPPGADVAAIEHLEDVEEHVRGFEVRASA